MQNKRIFVRRIILIAAAILVCFLLQTTIFKKFSLFSVTPNLLIVITAAFGFMRGKREGMIVGFISGLLIDIFFGSVLGFNALVYLYIGFVNGLFKKSFYSDDVKLPIVLIAGSDLACNLIEYLFQFVFRMRLNFGYYFIHIIVPELVYTMICAVVIYFILLKLNTHIEMIEKRGARKFG